MANYRMFVVCSKENDEEKKPIVAFNVYYDEEKQKTEFVPVVLDDSGKGLVEVDTAKMKNFKKIEVDDTATVVVEHGWCL